jgi:regulator of cell morphogenesis and NO signaling
MTSLAPDTPLGRLVAEHTSLARVFDRIGLDYCCGGRTTLAQACAEKGLDVGEVLRELESDGIRGMEADRSDGAAVTMGKLVDQIVASHHVYLRSELPRLAGLLAKVAEAHANRHPELRELHHVFAGLSEELESHMLKEEKVLFPMIKQLEAATAMPRLHCGSVNNPILVMEHEHAYAGSALQRMRALTGGFQPPGDACPTYRALMQGLVDLETDLHRHIHKENNILFPRASALEAALRGA